MVRSPTTVVVRADRAPGSAGAGLLQSVGRRVRIAPPSADADRSESGAGFGGGAGIDDLDSELGALQAELRRGRGHGVLERLALGVDVFARFHAPPSAGPRPRSRGIAASPRPGCSRSSR